MVLAKFYHDVITEAVYSLSTLRLTPSLVNFVLNKEQEGRPMMVKRKLDGTVDKSSADQKIRKSDASVHNM